MHAMMTMMMMTMTMMMTMMMIFQYFFVDCPPVAPQYSSYISKRGDSKHIS